MNRFLLVVVLAIPVLTSCTKREAAAANPAQNATGRYEVMAGEATAQDGSRMALIVRIDRTTGESWALKQQKISELGPSVTPERIEALQVGMAWEWVKIADASPPPQ